MTDFETAVTANIRKLAKLVEQIARLNGYEQTAVTANETAEDILDAYNQHLTEGTE